MTQLDTKMAGYVTRCPLWRAFPHITATFTMFVLLVARCIARISRNCACP
jgi:hypothetical protein